MKLTKEIREDIKQYCLDAINSDDVELTTAEEKLKYAYDRFRSECFRSEFDHTKRQGEFKAFSGWLQGLSLDIAFYESDILELAIRWGQNPMTEAQEEKIISGYWDFMTNQYFKLFKKYKIAVL